MNVLCFMVDITNLNENFAIMEQATKVWKNSINAKNLKIAQLMSNLDIYNYRESHHNLKLKKKLIFILSLSLMTIKV